MEERKLTKADIDKVRHIEGFPIAKDEDIIALSRPPYYTACPNPFIEEFIQENGTPYDEATDDYHREPFAADVSEGKNDPIYMAHSYHTKVPYKAIMRYILHYTKPGDIVLDGFCGTGMAGVAAQMCGCPDDDTRYIIEHDNADDVTNWGTRNAIVSDLAPIASFISDTYNHSCSSAEFYELATRIIKECKDEFGWMFQTKHVDDKGKPVQDITGADAVGELNYVVWSDAFVCPTCSHEFVFWDVAVDNERGKVLDKFFCPHCHAELTKRDCTHAVEGFFDTALQKTVQMAKQVPVLIAYFYSGKRYQKKPDLDDLNLIKKIEEFTIPYPCPTRTWPEGEKTKEPIARGIEHVHQMYTKRNLAVLSAFCAKAKGTAAMILMHSVATVNSKLYRYRWAGGVPGAGGGPLSGTLYIPSILKDISMLKSLSEYEDLAMEYMPPEISPGPVLPIPKRTETPTEETPPEHQDESSAVVLDSPETEPEASESPDNTEEPPVSPAPADVQEATEAPEITERPVLETDETAAPTAVITAAPTKKPVTPTAVPTQPASDINLEACLSQNRDFVAWLTIPGTKINYPVVRSDNTEYYLHHLFTGKESKLGCLFSLKSSDYQTPSKNIAIYGHHISHSDAMFSTLMDYKDASYCSAHSLIRVSSLYGDRTYRVFAVLNMKVSDWDAATASFSSDESFMRFINRAIKKSMVDTGVQVTAEDNILTLITCDRSYGGASGRLIVMAVQE